MYRNKIALYAELRLSTILDDCKLVKELENSNNNDAVHAQGPRHGFQRTGAKGPPKAMNPRIVP